MWLMQPFELFLAAVHLGKICIPLNENLMTDWCVIINPSIMPLLLHVRTLILLCVYHQRPFQLFLPTLMEFFFSTVGTSHNVKDIMDKTDHFFSVLWKQSCKKNCTWEIFSCVIVTWSLGNLKGGTAFFSQGFSLFCLSFFALNLKLSWKHLQKKDGS